MLVKINAGETFIALFNKEKEKKRPNILILIKFSCIHKNNSLPESFIKGKVATIGRLGEVGGRDNSCSVLLEKT